MASELGKVSSKLKSVTSQKSSEILMSAAEEIHLQLQNVHSQIQTDMYVDTTAFHFWFPSSIAKLKENGTNPVPSINAAFPLSIFLHAQTTDTPSPSAI